MSDKTKADFPEWFENGNMKRGKTYEKFYTANPELRDSPNFQKKSVGSKVKEVLSSAVDYLTQKKKEPVKKPSEPRVLEEGDPVFKTPLRAPAFEEDEEDRPLLKTEKKLIVKLNKDRAVPQTQGFDALNDALLQRDKVIVKENDKEPVFTEKQGDATQVYNPVKIDKELEEEIKLNYNTQTGADPDATPAKPGQTSGFSDPLSLARSGLGNPENDDLTDFENALSNKSLSKQELINEYNDFVKKNENDGEARDYAKQIFDNAIETYNQLALNPNDSNLLPFAVDQVPIQHPVKYHPNSILFYFGSIKSPDWDLELEKNVFSADLKKNEIIMYSDAIVKNYGTVLFVFARKSDTIQEFHELIQLQFCYIRNLARGSRTKNALIPISDLVSFANSLNGSGDSKQIVENDEQLLEDVEDVREVAKPTENIIQPVQVQLSVNDSINNILEQYKNKKFDNHAKPIISAGLVKSTQKRSVSFTGSQAKLDPTENYLPRTNVKIVKF